MDDFEKMLTDLPKPEVTELRHQEMLAGQIARSGNRQALSVWWLLIPLYVLAMLGMKTFYIKTSMKQELILFKIGQPVLAFLLFLLAPVIIILFNVFFTARRTRIGIILAVLSLIVLFIYMLTCYV